MGEARPSTTSVDRRKVLVLGSPLEYIDKEYYDKFREDYDVQVCVFIPEKQCPSSKHPLADMISKVLDAKDRAETIAKLGKKVDEDGPFEALVCKMVCTSTHSPRRNLSLSLSLDAPTFDPPPAVLTKRT